VSKNLRRLYTVTEKDHILLSEDGRFSSAAFGYTMML